MSALEIDGGTDINAALADSDLLIVDDGAGGTNRKVALSRVKTYVEDAAGEVPIANLDIDGGTDIGAAIADADLFIIDDGAGGTNRKTTASRIKTYVGASSGGFAIANLDIDGGTDINADLVDADEIIVDDGGGGTNRRSDLTRVKKYIFSALSGDATASDSGALTIANGSVENAMLAGSIANAKLSNSAITVTDGSSSTATSLGGTITFSGTNNEVEVAESSGTITIGLPDNVTIAGNLTVSGTTTQTGAVTSNDNFNILSNNNTGNSTDFGLAGKYVESSTTKYAGIFFDASTDNTFRLFTDTQTEPSTTVNTGATGYAAANLIVGTLTASSIVIGSTAVTSTADELNILDGVTASATDINLIDGITNGTVIASKAIITDSNKDISGGRNITISGELDAATLDISGDADIDGTLEADAITVNGTALNTVIADESTALAIALG